MITNSVRAYRNSAVDGATHLDILLACYDSLAEDIRLSGIAAEKGDYVARCRHSQHAFLLLGHLESWVDLHDEPELRDGLARFYGYARQELLRLQSARDFGCFTQLAMLVCETRGVWQRKYEGSISSAVAPVEQNRSAQEAEGSSRFVLSA